VNTPLEAFRSFYARRTAASAGIPAVEERLAAAFESGPASVSSERARGECSPRRATFIPLPTIPRFSIRTLWSRCQERIRLTTANRAFTRRAWEPWIPRKARPTSGSMFFALMDVWCFLLLQRKALAGCSSSLAKAHTSRQSSFLPRCSFRASVVGMKNSRAVDGSIPARRYGRCVRAASQHTFRRELLVCGGRVVAVRR
jgi:hypothetical protein